MSPHHLILASESPQRSSLLRGLGMNFMVVPSGLDEAACPETDPAMRAMVLAVAKAQRVCADHPGHTVIGCDTLVEASDGSILEKPVDADDARRMLLLHSGRTCTVHSGLCVARDKDHREAVSSSSVTFASLSPSDVDWWIATGLWQSRSGAFQIDGPGQLMIERIDGDWTSIVGLPVYLLGQLLREMGVDVCS